MPGSRIGWSLLPVSLCCSLTSLSRWTMRAVQVQLACECYARWDLFTNGKPVPLQDELWTDRAPSVMVCKYDGQQHVVKVWPNEWHVRCNDDECRFSRWCGQSEDVARRFARVHKLKGAMHGGTVLYDKVTPDGRGAWFREK